MVNPMLLCANEHFTVSVHSFLGSFSDIWLVEVPSANDYMQLFDGKLKDI